MRSSMFRVVLLALVTLTALSTGHAAGETPPVEKYRGEGNGAIILCKVTLKLSLLRAQVGQADDEKSDYAGCIAKAKTEAKVNFDLAMKTVKKTKAKEALKSYHVALMTALDGINPGLGERKISYEQRQQGLDDKLNEAWARFEIEQ